MLQPKYGKEGAAAAGALPFIRVARPKMPGGLRAPEISATDGRTLRRLVAADRQIYLQDTQRPGLGAPLITHIEEGLHRGQSLVGYSLLDDASAVCIRLTGDDDELGWLAFREKTPLSSSFIKSLDEVPRRRLVAGMTTGWRGGQFFLFGALEERGDTDRDVSLLDALEEIALAATRADDEKRQLIRLARKEPLAEELKRTNSRQLRFRIPVDARLFEDADEEICYWLRFQFAHSLICLPQRWRQLHMEFRLQ